MTTQLEQDVKLAESVGFCHYSPSVYTTKKDEIHALCNKIREQAVPDGYVVVPIKPTEAMEHAAVKYAGDCILQEVYPNGSYKKAVSLDSEMFGRAYKAMLSAAPREDE